MLPATQPAHDEPTPRKRVVSLVRVSTQQQAGEHAGGIPRQRQIIERTISARNLDCLRVYEIADCSGTDVRNHPDIRELLQLIATRVVDGLVVADLDRLFRPDQPTDFALLQVFKDTAATIYSGDTVYELGTKDGLLFSGIRSAISGFELQLMRERQQGAKEEKRKKGLNPCNELTMPLGIGYDRKQQRYFYTERIATVVDLFKLYDSGVRNFMELERRTGVHHATIRNLLRNSIYTGVRCYKQKRGDKRRSKTGKVYRVKTERPPEQRIKVKVLDAVVSQEQFDRVQELMAQTTFNHHERRSVNETINYAAGLVTCGHCGEPFYVSSGKRTKGNKRFGYAHCRANNYLFRAKLGGCKQPNIRAEIVDKGIEDFTCKILTDPATLAALIADSVQRTSEVVTPFPAPNRDAELSALKKRERRLLDAYESGDMTLDELRPRREEIRNAIAAVERRDADGTKKQKFDLDSFARLVVKGALRLRGLRNRKEKKILIHDLFSEIVLRDHAIVGFKFREDLRRALPLNAATANAMIVVDPPFRLAVQEVLLEGQRRCLHCEQALPVAQFRGRSNVCRTCTNKQILAAYHRRRAARSATPAAPS